MNDSSPILLIGIGGAGCRMASRVMHTFGNDLRHVLVDTDSSVSTPLNGEPFVLLGGDRLSGHGSGGDVVAARMAAEDSVRNIDEHLEGVRLAVFVTALGGGTGGGATVELAKHLAQLGILSIVFATTPFTFEGEDRQRTSRGVMSMIEENASAAFFLPLDRLVADVDNMDDAMSQAIDTLASGVTLFWRMLEKPGYLRLDAERVRHLISHAGRGRFASVTCQGPNRAQEGVEALIRSELLSVGQAPVRSMLCGILAGADLRLAEVDTVATALRKAFGERIHFELATVNDEETFSGRLAIVLMLLEYSPKDAVTDHGEPHGGRHNGKPSRNSVLNIGPTGRGRFQNAEQTIWNGEDLDIPTYLRQNINLDF